MIPTIEDILADLIAGTMTQERALHWLHQHMETDGLRDHFAGLAMQGDIASMEPHNDPLDASHHIAKRAYAVADAMLEARK